MCVCVQVCACVCLCVSVCVYVSDEGIMTTRGKERVANILFLLTNRKKPNLFSDWRKEMKAGTEHTVFNLHGRSTGPTHRQQWTPRAGSINHRELPRTCEFAFPCRKSVVYESWKVRIWDYQHTRETSRTQCWKSVGQGDTLHQKAAGVVHVKSHYDEGTSE